MRYSRFTAGLLVLSVLFLSSCGSVFRSYGGYPSFAPVLRRVMLAVVSVSTESRVAYEHSSLARDPKFRRFLK